MKKLPPGGDTGQVGTQHRVGTAVSTVSSSHTEEEDAGSTIFLREGRHLLSSPNRVGKGVAGWSGQKVGPAG